MNDQDLLLKFFKALADANRLKIVGLLAKQPHTVEQLAEALGLGASTVSHHLSKLSEAGLVSAKARSYYNDYQLETRKIEEMAYQLLSMEALTAVPAQFDQSEYDRKILHDFMLSDGRLKTIPVQRKKLMAVLRYLANDFAPGRRYSEKQVNEILARYHEDTASLRRELISSGLMKRESSGRVYWRSQDETDPAGPMKESVFADMSK
jgi:biotin operon repressor